MIAERRASLPSCARARNPKFGSPSLLHSSPSHICILSVLSLVINDSLNLPIMESSASRGASASPSRSQIRSLLQCSSPGSIVHGLNAFYETRKKHRERDSCTSHRPNSPPFLFLARSAPRKKRESLFQRLRILFDSIFSLNSSIPSYSH